MKRSVALVAFCFAAPSISFGAFDSAYEFQVKETTPSWISKLRAVLAPNQGELQITVLDSSGNPLSGATLLLGAAEGNPFAGNKLTTDASGKARFVNESLNGTLPSLTAAKAGYSTFTVVAPSGNALEIRLPKLPADGDFAFLRGKVNGFPTGYPSTVLEMGVFVPAFRPESLLNFDPQQFVSSYTMPINVFGERQVPGNVLLPTQRKRYGFIPISLSKPDFAMPLSKGLRARMAAMAGAVPISDVIGAIQNSDFLGALNLASFTHVTWTAQAIDVQGPMNFDLTVDHEVAPKALKANFANVPGGLDIVGVSLVDPSLQVEDFVALDVKGFKAENVKNGAASLSLGLLKDRSGDTGYYAFAGLFDRNQMADLSTKSRSIIGALKPLTARDITTTFDGFLNRIQSQGVSPDNRTYRFTSPINSSAQLVPDMVIVNIVSETDNEETKGKNRRTLWSAMLPGDASSVSLPDLGTPVLPTPDQSKGESFHWEVIAVKASSASGSDIQSLLRNLRHVSSLIEKF
jgi:hypothetical protein